MSTMTRRQFLKSSALGASCLAVAPALAAQPGDKPAGANGDIRFAVVGFNGRGGGHLSGTREVQGTRLAALCDVYSNVLAGEISKSEKRGEKVEGYKDIRKLLENKDIDAVTFATPNHWHSLGAIWAVQAGKDVYVEKPVSHNVWEGRKIVEAARKHNRIVQTGTQCRSSVGLQEAIAWIQA